jgi:hypothetical protein
MDLILDMEEPTPEACFYGFFCILYLINSLSSAFDTKEYIRFSKEFE